MDKVLFVALGGAIGAVLRYISVGWVGRVAGDLSIGTMFVNVFGSFILGMVAVLMLERHPETLSRFAPFIVTGVLGAFTTFSAFSLDAFRLFENGRMTMAVLYVGGSVALSLAGLVLGASLMRSL